MVDELDTDDMLLLRERPVPLLEVFDIESELEESVVDEARDDARDEARDRTGVLFLIAVSIFEFPRFSLATRSLGDFGLGDNGGLESEDKLFLRVLPLTGTELPSDVSGFEVSTSGGGRVEGLGGDFDITDENKDSGVLYNLFNTEGFSSSRSSVVLSSGSFTASFTAAFAGRSTAAFAMGLDSNFAGCVFCVCVSCLVSSSSSLSDSELDLNQSKTLRLYLEVGLSFAAWGCGVCNKCVGIFNFGSNSRLDMDFWNTRAGSASGIYVLNSFSGKAPVSTSCQML